ncbi:MAG: monooxygenase [Amycolatopsis sp.]|uniref:LLM class flavin-dependent oxidoreductase n=1 Tax=Amycolatopsis sp. TaxID=37632 RepID=UPI00260F17E8|nr:LLM class flavin-dependent oxidoreductase [Amycolatopsis sp.]MCU1680994.1 monooxygenase [Amycolatopsis sp.]
MTKFGLLLPMSRAHLDAGGTARDVVETAVEAERLGYESVWVGDTLMRASLDPLTLLSALATATEQVILGTAALLAPLRDPILAANTISSIDLLSGGRLTLAVGSGFPGRSDPEFDLVGVPLEGRNARLDDIVALWRHLWSGGKSFHGKVLHYDSLPELPYPHRHGGPPIWLAGFTPKVLERAGRSYDGWLPYPPNPEDFASGLAAVRAAAPDADAVTPALFATVLIAEDAERGRRGLEQYCLANYGAPVEYIEKIQVLMTGSASQVAAQLARYGGARHVLIRPAALAPSAFREQVSQVAGMITDIRGKLS